MTPAAELCATPVDESCDGVPHCPQVPPWARGYGGAGHDRGLSIVSDASGNYYVSGDFEGTVDFGAGPLTSAGQSDVFLLKLDPSGSLIWSKRFGTEYEDDSTALTIDESGNIFLAGVYEGHRFAVDPGPDFGGGAIQPAEGAALFLVQFDPEGNHIWSDGFQVSIDMFLPTKVARIAVDSVGSAYILYGSDEQSHLAKISAGGTALLWKTTPSGAIVGSMEGGLAVDSADNVLVAIPDQYFFFSPFGSEFTVSKLAPTGALLWERSFASELLFTEDIETSSHSLVVTAADEVIVTGFVDDTVDIEGRAPERSPVLLKLDASGEVIFSRAIPYHHRVVLDPAGGMFVAGHRGFAKLDDSGTSLWSFDFDSLPGAGSGFYMADIALSPNGTVAITGSTYAPADFGTGPIPYAAGADSFVATIVP